MVRFTWLSAAQPRPRSRILLAMCFCEGMVWRVLGHMNLDGNCMSPHLQDASRIIKVSWVESWEVVYGVAIGICTGILLQMFPVHSCALLVFLPDSGCRSVTRVSGMAGLRSASSSASGSLKGTVKTCHDMSRQSRLQMIAKRGIVHILQLCILNCHCCHASSHSKA